MSTDQYGYRTLVLPQPDKALSGAEYLLSRSLPFCLVSFPGDESLHLFSNPSRTAPMQDGYFVVKPCWSSKRDTLYFVPIDLSSHEHMDTCTSADRQEETVKEDYQQNFNGLMAAFAKGSLQKAVLSRLLVKSRPAHFKSLAFFKKLHESYSDACVFLINHPQMGLWAGASPEVLLHGSAEQYQTVSLAATKAIDNIDRPWSPKETREQALVSLHIRQVLKEIGTQAISEDGPNTVVAGNVAHLKSTFKFQLNDPAAIDSLLQKLHPTPAIAGYPVEAAKQYIYHLEKHSRNLYTGYIGKIDPNQNIQLYVTLRCVQIFDEELCIYVGGGILPDSDGDAEWRETDQKAQTLLNIIEANG